MIPRVGGGPQWWESNFYTEYIEKNILLKNQLAENAEILYGKHPWVEKIQVCLNHDF